MLGGDFAYDTHVHERVCTEGAVYTHWQRFLVAWRRECWRRNWSRLKVAGIIRSPKRAKSERVVELVIGNMSGWILQDVGSVARPWEHPLFWGGDGPPLLLSLATHLLLPTTGLGWKQESNWVSYSQGLSPCVLTVSSCIRVSLRFSDFSIRLFACDPGQPTEATPEVHRFNLANCTDPARFVYC